METRGKNRSGVRVPRGTYPGVSKVKFTPALWHKWLAEFNGDFNGVPDQRIAERTAAIKEFRSLCNKPLARASEHDKNAPTQEGTNKCR